jgi:hypothetical protein
MEICTLTLQWHCNDLLLGPPRIEACLPRQQSVYRDVSAPAWTPKSPCRHLLGAQIFIPVGSDGKRSGLTLPNPAVTRPRAYRTKLVLLGEDVTPRSEVISYPTLTASRWEITVVFPLLPVCRLKDWHKCQLRWNIPEEGCPGQRQ